MSCTNHRDALQELADGTLGPIRRAELQVHLESCARCRSLASDLVRIKDLAASLDRLSPPEAVWLQVAGRLRQEGRLAGEAEAPRTSKRRMAALAIAAALVIAVGASIVTLLPPGGEAPTPQTAQEGNAATQDPVQSFGNEIRLAEQHLQNAIAKLEQAATSDEDVMDPQTAETLKKQLQVMDQAIAESRDALRVEPQSASARDHFFGAMKRKVGVLQDTISAINDIRKGNPAGTGQLVEGLNKS